MSRELGAIQLLAGASSIFGGALGFLFGIPRTLQQGELVTSGDQDQDSTLEEPQSPKIGYRVNTNLEQISDWLTKILVGVSLTQIGEIRNGLTTLGEMAARGLGEQSSSQVFAISLICFFAVIGFLFGYLWTRLFFTLALKEADQATIGALVREVEETTKKVNEIERQAERDATALLIADRQLNPSTDVEPVSQEDLNAAISAASRPVKVQVFNRAWQVRSENWRSDKPKMELTIPLFQALVETDKHKRYHMNHGQLGFALKDKTKPDWAEAERALTTAIARRNEQHDRGWLLYEFNRAHCNIKLDPDFGNDLPSKEDRKEEIVEDLAAAARAADLQKYMKSDPDISSWMKLNKVTINKLEQH